MKFRSAQLQDLDYLINSLHNDDLGKNRESVNKSSLLSYKNALENILKDPNAQLILGIDEDEDKNKDKIIAMAQVNFLTYLTYQGGMRAQIEGVRVDETYRGQGLGKQLINHIIEVASNNGCHMVQLTTNKLRPNAIKFYEKIGFESTHEGMKLNT
jgi:ribosomal protein S18 acetylase RimI-like enzyme